MAVLWRSVEEEKDGGSGVTWVDGRMLFLGRDRGAYVVLLSWPLGIITG